ncbi:MAG TPA: 16S rRNA (guanine(966)-N(2))-methyltransferase RsmD [Pyrinomonadaceae bacterium]|nr:16S rRNA (guanine(966)-N(2))-methyltransferase RsmD [Pyrinomonadaceae bacterium]
MRIIAGKYRGRVLKSPSGSKTRPTSDRLRETLFNILAPRISDETRFLDLCAGTGAIGIEALSRGADFTTFVDKSRRACALIEENLDALGIPEEQTEIFSSPAENFINRKAEEGWDIVFYDPPYQENYAIVLHAFGDSESNLLNPGGIVIAEHHAKNILPDKAQELRRWRLLKQGENCLSFYEKS